MIQHPLPLGVLFPTLWLLVFALSILNAPGLGAQDQITLIDVKIAGNIRVEDDGIRLHLKSRAGAIFDPNLVEQDVKAIYRMGFFDDVHAELSPAGVLTYVVKEKPYVRELNIQGHSQVGRDKIEAALGVMPRTILDRAKLAEGIEKVRRLYAEQGYVNAAVDYAVSLEENNQAFVVLDINEGSRLLIQSIRFEGNKAFSDGELRGLMATRPEWIFSFITNRGVLDRDILTNDIAIIANHYYDHGYIDHRIAEPIVLRGRDGLEVVIRVEEGEQYRVGKVEIGGDLIKDGREMLSQVRLTTGQIFRGSRLREDITTLTEMYSDRGYAFAQVEPVTKVNAAERNVDVALLVSQGPPVYFNRILISGNTKTRDKVVRRELVATEQELYSGTKITQSRNALQRTGYFEDVQFNTKKTEQPDAVDLLVEVKEGPTGAFTVGAGYSSGDGFLFNASISERNLMGRGQGINARFIIGSRRQDFILGFTEPYLYDTYVGLGVDAFNTQRDYSDFNERRTGFGVNTSYPLNRLTLPFFGAPRHAFTPGLDDLATEPPMTAWDYMRGGIGYELTRDKIGGIGPGASSAIRAEAGTSFTSAMIPNLVYDSRDHFFNPTEGTRSGLSMKFAGLGGDNRFIKSDLSGRWHYPLLKDPNWGGAYVLALGGSVGWGVGFQQHAGRSNALPLFERYFLGGINSVRGFAERSIGPRVPANCDIDGNNCTDFEVIGGEKAAVANVELLFPIYEQFGLRGVAFFDMGNAFNDFNFSDFRQSVGVGGRWLSPFGPLRVEFGFPINKKRGDETSVVGFTIGAQP